MKSFFKIIVEIKGEVNRYNILAESPKGALEKFYKLINITVAENDENANYEVIYFLNGRKRFVMVYAAKTTAVFKRLKEKLGKDVYDKIQVIAINELNQETLQEQL